MRNRRVEMKPVVGHGVPDSGVPDKERNRRLGLMPIFLVMAALSVLFAIVTTMISDRTTTDEEDHGVQRILSNTRDSERFPRYGTPAFTQQCNWTIYPPVKQECVLLLQPQKQNNEGIADWITRVVAGYISAKLMGGCQLFMNYGPDVDIHQVFVPQSDSMANNWTVPPGFVCRYGGSHNCSLVHFQSMLKSTSTSPTKSKRRKLPLAPNYRHVFKGMPPLSIYRDNFQHIEPVLPGFQLETAMACSFESLVTLSPLASQFEPDLFSRILPTLRDGRNLVMAVYFRSGKTDGMAFAEEKGNATHEENTEHIRGKVTSSIQCVLNIEKQYLTNSSLSRRFSRIVWLVVSDSQYAKQWFTEEFTSPNVIYAGSGAQVREGLAATIPREILTTIARGAHTRASRNPSTADFAEGMIDWYLIGESDVVFVNGNGYTFGSTGAFRTARPLYFFGGETCYKAPSFIHEEKAPTVQEFKAGERAARDNTSTH